MPEKLDYYIDIAEDWVEEYKDLRKIQQGLDDLAHLEYHLPARLEEMEWVRKFMSSIPAEALSAAERTLSGIPARVKIDPISAVQDDEDYVQEEDAIKARSNAWEKALEWQFDLAERRHGMLQKDIASSALRQDEICAKIVFLPEVIKSKEAVGGDANRYKAIKSRGEFTFILCDPKSVYTRYSNYGLEALMHTQVVTPQMLVDNFGNKVKNLAKRMDDEDDDLPESFVLFEYTDYKDIVIWAMPGEDVTQSVNYGDDPKDNKDNIIEIERRDNPYPFLNGWVHVKGGTILESDPKYQRRALLWTVLQAQQWSNANVMGTLLLSEAIAKAAAPTATREGPNPNSVEIEYGEIGQPVNVPPGHKYTQLMKEQLDPALKEGYDRMEAAMQQGSVSRILMTADPVPNESFSGQNLRYKTASDSLNPWRKECERFLAESFRQMLLWIHHTGDDLKGYGKDRKNMGRAYAIKAKDIHPDRLYVSSKLIPDVPIDRLQQINGAINLAREMRYPLARILEELDVADPEESMAEWVDEQFDLAAVQGKQQMIAMSESGQLEQMINQRAQEMVQQMMEQQQAAPQQQGAPYGGPPEAQGMAGAMGGAPPDLTGGMGMEGVGGMGMNPGMGGTPPAQANPAGNVREQQTGQAGGIPLA